MCHTWAEPGEGFPISRANAQAGHDVFPGVTYQWTAVGTNGEVLAPPLEVAFHFQDGVRPRLYIGGFADTHRNIWKLRFPRGLEVTVLDTKVLVLKDVEEVPKRVCKKKRGGGKKKKRESTESVEKDCIPKEVAEARGDEAAATGLLEKNMNLLMVAEANALTAVKAAEVSMVASKAALEAVKAVKHAVALQNSGSKFSAA